MVRYGGSHSAKGMHNQSRAVGCEAKSENTIQLEVAFLASVKMHSSSKQKTLWGACQQCLCTLRTQVLERRMLFSTSSLERKFAVDSYGTGILSYFLGPNTGA